jgi:hypothetical protein
MAVNPAQNPLTTIVRSGLKSSSAASLISASFKFGQQTVDEATPAMGRGSAVAKLNDGRELRVNQKGPNVVVELVEGGKVQGPPSGRFTLADGKSIVVENGTVVGGDVFSEASFAMFALLTEFPGGVEA